MDPACCHYSFRWKNVTGRQSRWSTVGKHAAAMTTKRKAVLTVNVAALILGGTIIFPKLIDLPAGSIIFVRCGVAFVTLLGFSLTRRTALRRVTRRDLVFLCLLGIVMAAHWVALFHGIQISTVAVAGLAFYTYPVMTALLEPLVFRDRFRFQEMGVAAAAFVGVCLIMPGVDVSDTLFQGVVPGLLSALLLAVRNIANRVYMRRYPATTLMLYQVMAATLVLVPVSDIDYHHVTTHTWVLLILLGSLFTALPHTLFTASLRVLTAKTVGVIASIQPFYAIVFAALLLGEIPTGRILAGGVVIVACSIVESIMHNGQDSPDDNGA